MSRNPFEPSLEILPGTLPIFPLAGVLLLPRGRLPLNIFEPRYLAMVEDALASDRLIGIIQPSGPGVGEAPPVYRTGCAGRITEFRETDDGRFLITLTGVCRFGLDTELAMARGYRRVRPAWQRFAGDLALPEEDALLDRGRLFGHLKPFFEQQGIAANWAAIESTPDERLIASLAMGCPFEPTDKQALLEAMSLKDRARLLVSLIEMAVLGHGAAGSARRH